MAQERSRSRSPPEDDRRVKRQRGSRSPPPPPSPPGPASLDEAAVSRQFEAHKRAAGFQKLHHPEQVAAGLRAQREAARRALRQLIVELKQGCLLGPRLQQPAGAAGAAAPSDASVPSPGEVGAPTTASEAAGEVVMRLRPMTPSPHGLMVDKLAPSALCAMLPVLFSALAGGRGDDAGDAGGTPGGLTAVSIADPIPDDRGIGDAASRKLRLRVWAGYGSPAAAARAAAAATTLPQLGEMVRPPSFQEGPPPPLREPLPPQPPASQLLPALEEVADAIADRLCIPRLSAAASSALSAPPLSSLPPDHRLQLLLLYLRRVLAFDPQRATEHASPMELIVSAGESALAALPLPEAPGTDAAALAKRRWRLHTDHLAALAAADAKAAAAAAAAATAFYKANCVEIEPGKFRCPLSGKLFRDPVFVRKHVDNKHSAKVDTEIASSLLPKYAQYFLASEARFAEMAPLEPPRPPPPSPPRERSPDPPPPRGRGGRGRECFNCGREGHIARECTEPRMPPRGRGGRSADGRPPPPPPGAAAHIDRPIISYNDLDAPDDDPLFD